jgi:tetratricopeptide (TPR) repeat protein
MLGLILTEHGRSLRSGGKTHEAEVLLDESISRLAALRDGPLDAKRLQGFDPGVIRDNAVFLVAFAEVELGLARSADPKRRQDALRAFDTAIATLNGLLRRSSIPLRRTTLGMAYLGRGALRSEAADGESDWNEARKVLENIANEFPLNPTYQGSLARVLERLGKLALDKGDRSSARSLFIDAMRRTRLALEANPDSPDDRVNLDRLRKDLGGIGEKAAQ